MRPTAPTLASYALLAAAIFAAPVAAQAEFHGKGSVVGRILSESVAAAEDPTPTPSPTPVSISRESLNALMKHPTEPVFDPLRPMSGRWVRCQRVIEQSAPVAQSGSQAVCDKPGCTPNTIHAATHSVQDRYSSSDREHFTHTVVSASDSECKTVISEERKTYECASADKTTLSCKVTKLESKAGGGAWTTEKLTGSEGPLKLSFVGVEKPGKHRKKAHDPRTLELRIVPEGGQPESVHLEFVPSTPHSHKTND